MMFMIPIPPTINETAMLANRIDVGPKRRRLASTHRSERLARRLTYLVGTRLVNKSNDSQPTMPTHEPMISRADTPRAGSSQTRVSSFLL